MNIPPIYLQINYLKFLIVSLTLFETNFSKFPIKFVLRAEVTETSSKLSWKHPQFLRVLLDNKTYFSLELSLDEKFFRAENFLMKFFALLIFKSSLTLLKLSATKCTWRNPFFSSNSLETTWIINSWVKSFSVFRIKINEQKKGRKKEIRNEKKHPKVN